MSFYWQSKTLSPLHHEEAEICLTVPIFHPCVPFTNEKGHSAAKLFPGSA